MKLAVKILAACLFLASVSVRAETLVCEGEVNFYGTLQKFKVTIEGDGIGQAYTKSEIRRIEVQGASLATPNVFQTANDYWDGHSSGLITAAGFSMTYENVFGCIRNAVVTTDFRGDVAMEGETVGHITQSQVIALCQSSQRTCN